MDEDGLYGVKSVAKMLNMSEYMVRHWARKGQLQHERIDGGTAIVFRGSEIRRFREMISGLRVADVAALCGVVDGTVRGWASDGTLKHRKVLSELLFDEADVRQFAAERGIVLHDGHEDDVRKVA